MRVTSQRWWVCLWATDGARRQVRRCTQWIQSSFPSKRFCEDFLLGRWKKGWINQQSGPGAKLSRGPLLTPLSPPTFLCIVYASCSLSTHGRFIISCSQPQTLTTACILCCSAACSCNQVGVWFDWLLSHNIVILFKGHITNLYN